ncbi:uncharacterized protein LOC106011756 [Aplysia californica]|uniref:Uncharacterized protein LOC106011756 n=1 Tax=Aplysia californica TaxID=6500 RepID=A0ABM0ZZT8_APLCA|nr:uncharacterized protein LOC106011756 [Aplysia californica]
MHGRLGHGVDLKQASVSQTRRNTDVYLQKMTLESPTKQLLWVLVLIAVLFTLRNILWWTFEYGFRTGLLSGTRWYRYTSVCEIPDDVKSDMVTLLSKSFRAMNKLGMSPVVCFGTLWGALRYNDILPWDNNIDVCVLNSDIVNNITFSSMVTSFWEEGVTLHHYNHLSGSYRFTFEKADGYINVFHDCTEHFYGSHSEIGHDYPRYLSRLPPPRWVCPSGFANKMFVLTYDGYKPFPRWLIEPPFKNGSVAGIPVPVPHDDFEMQKYLYPSDEWVEKRPRGC